MGFLDHNANFGLLILVAVIALALVGVTLFFQEKFDEVNQDYDAKVKSLEEATESLVTSQSEMEDLSETLDVKEQREVTLSKNYVDVVKENEKLKEDNSELKNNLAVCADDLRVKEDECCDLNDEIVDLEKEIKGLKGE